MEKAKVLEKAQQLYAKIRELVTRVEGHKKQFFDKRNALDQELDLFYTEAALIKVRSKSNLMSC